MDSDKNGRGREQSWEQMQEETERNRDKLRADIVVGIQKERNGET